MQKCNRTACAFLHYSYRVCASYVNHSARQPSYLCGSCQRSVQNFANTLQSFFVKHFSCRPCRWSWSASTVHSVSHARGNGLILLCVGKDFASCVFHFLYRICSGDCGLEFRSLHLRRITFEIPLEANIFASEKSVCSHLAYFGGLPFCVSLCGFYNIYLCVREWHNPFHFGYFTICKPQDFPESSNSAHTTSNSCGRWRTDENEFNAARSASH